MNQPLQLSTHSQRQYDTLPEQQQTLCWAFLGVLLSIMIVVYWDMFTRISDSWYRAQYSHGFLIPVFAAALLALRRQPFRDVPMWQRWLGVGLIAIGTLMRVVGGITVVFVADNFSFIPCVLGIFLIVGGLPCLKWAGPAACFLLFMYPLPRVAEEKIMYPLQKLATMCSNVVLVTLGVDSVREGNLITLASRSEPLNVAEQCSGLRMLTIFTALAVAMALLFTEKTWWERAIIVLSAVPIALAVNVFRITLTGILYNMNVNQELADKIFHDLAGWIMMPLALGLLYLEIYVMGKLFVDVPQEVTPLQVGNFPAKPAS